MNRKIGVILSYILMVFEIMSTLLLTPFIVRTLGQAEYGVYKLVTVINGYLLLLDLGIGNATIKFVSKYRTTNDKENESKFLGIVTAYYLAIALIAIIIGIILGIAFPYIFSKGLNAEEIILGKKLIIITMITTAVTLGTSAYSNVIISYERFGVSKLTQIIMIIIRIPVSFVLLKNGLGSLGLVLINLALTTISRVYFVYFVINKLKIIPTIKNIKKKNIKEIITYSSLILLQMIATQLNSGVDQLLIGSIVKNSAIILAIYGVGSQICQYFQSIGTAFTGVLMPGIVKMVEEKASSEEMANEMTRIGRIIFITLSIILAIFLVNGKEFIELWIGKENCDAYYVSLILMTAYLFTLTQSVGTQILWAKNEHKELSYLKITIVIINIIITIFLIKWNPLLGAVIGTFISILFGDILVVNYLLYKKIKINFKKYYCDLFNGILPCLSIIVLTGLLLNRVLYGNWLHFGIKVLILSISYLFLLWNIGMNKYEKNLIIQIKNKIIIGGKNNE